MAGLTQHILLSMFIQGLLLCCDTWHVKLPNSVKGLRGSCLVIPCSYEYKYYPPKNPSRVVWYQYASRGYPLVYDDWHPNDVIGIFRSRTSRYGPSNKCSLEINPVDWSHHRQKIYPWVDPENVGSSTYAFYDTTVTIEVQYSAESPVIQIIGNHKVGHEVTVQCHAVHTCPSHPPSLSLSIPTQRARLSHEALSDDGTIRTTLTAPMVLENDHQVVRCYVQHSGGLRAEAEQNIKAECSSSQLIISPDSGEFLEGKSREVTCSVEYTCTKHKPTFLWNYGGMPTSTDFKRLAGGRYRSSSTMSFTASTKDQGKFLTCRAHSTGESDKIKSIALQVKRSILSRDWTFTIPGSITAMRGSCVVIPCSFTYVTAQPAGLSVKWYLYQSQVHPLVYGEGETIAKYRGRTSLTGSMTQGNCSLQIERLETSHNQDRLYPWIDMKPITAYHSVEQTFYDKTVQLVVSDRAEQPQLSILGIPRVGEQSTLSCSVHHTCPLKPPTLILNQAPEPADRITHNAMPSTGNWEMTVERSWTVTEEDQRVSCTVTHPGGQTDTSKARLDVECPFEEITVREPGVFTEGVAKYVICSVSHKCKSDKPHISWNYDNMQSTVHTQEISKGTYQTLSNLTFIANLDDNGKNLKCVAQFLKGQTSASTTLVVKKYEKQIDDKYGKRGADNDSYTILAAEVLPKVSALTRSCVVIPCTFHVNDEPITNLRGIWYNRRGDFVYHNGQSLVLDHFKGRTRILGDLDQQNCTLEIDDIKPFDNGPFCFRAETGDDDKYSFNNSCVFIMMKASPGKPVMTPVPEEVDAGVTVKVACSVKHTCPSHSPVVSWSINALTTEVGNTHAGQGIWETSSTVTFVPTGDGPKYLNCTAIFWRGKEQTNTATFNVKGSPMPQLRSIVPVAVGLVIILAVIIGVIVWRKRANSAVRPPPRPEKRRSLWNRLNSSRQPQRPPRPVQMRTPIGRY